MVMCCVVIGTLKYLVVLDYLRVIKMEPENKSEHRVYTIDEINKQSHGRVLRLPRVVKGTTLFAVIMYGTFFAFPLASAVILASLLHPHTIFECAYTLFYVLACALGLYIAMFFMFGVLINYSSKKGD